MEPLLFWSDCSAEFYARTARRAQSANERNPYRIKASICILLFLSGVRAQLMSLRESCLTCFATIIQPFRIHFSFSPIYSPFFSNDARKLGKWYTRIRRYLWISLIPEPLIVIKNVRISLSPMDFWITHCISYICIQFKAKYKINFKIKFPRKKKQIFININFNNIIRY